MGAARELSKTDYNINWLTDTVEDRVLVHDGGRQLHWVDLLGDVSFANLRVENKAGLEGDQHDVENDVKEVRFDCMRTD